MWRLSWIGGAALALCGAGVAMGQLPADQSSPELPRVRQDVLVVDAPAGSSQYWLGVECLPVPPSLRAQLNLPENQGLLVGAVVPESPAAKAGVAPYDVLLHAGDKTLSDPRDLVQAVQTAKEGKLAIELIRGGQHKTVEATPTRQPAQVGPVVVPPGDVDFQKWLEGFQSGQPLGQPPLHFRVFRPGVIVPSPLHFEETPLPPNVSVVISKEGDQPAKITVKRGGEKWEVTEKELGKLPADVRPYVEHMLGPRMFGAVTSAMPAMPRARIEPGPSPGSVLLRSRQKAASRNVWKQWSSASTRWCRPWRI